MAAIQAELAEPIRDFIDGFNAGDLKAACATYAPGNTFSPKCVSPPGVAEDLFNQRNSKSVPQRRLSKK